MSFRRSWFTMPSAAGCLASSLATSTGRVFRCSIPCAAAALSIASQTAGT